MMENSDTTMSNSVDLVSDPTPGSVETLNRRSFRPISISHQEKLTEAWPMVKSLLEELGHSCSLDTVDSTVLVESPSSTDPYIVRKANYLLDLLCKTSVPAHLAIELALHGRQHDAINIVTQIGGMCKKYRNNEEEFDKFWRGLESSLKELEDLTRCTLYLNKETLIAVGPSPRLRWVRNVWKFCITGKLNPGHVVGVFNSKLKQPTITMANSDTMMVEKYDFCVFQQPKSNLEVNNPLNAEYSQCFLVQNQAKLKEAWPMVESSLEELGYLCAMNTVNSRVLIVAPYSTDPDMSRKANFLFRLLDKTHFPAPLAVDLALRGRQHDVIKLGTLKDGMCIEYRITKKKFNKQRRCLKRSLKELEHLTHCTLSFLEKMTLIAVGPSPRLHWVRKVWRYSVTGKLSPAHVIRVFNRKLNRSTTIMGNGDSVMEEKRDTIMVEKSDLSVLQEPKSDHVVNGPLPSMMSSKFSIPEQSKSNHEVSDTLLMKKNKMCFRLSAANRAKLKETWPVVKSALEKLGYMCSMSMDGSTFSLVLPLSTDPEITHKADYFSKLLFRTPVPAPLAIELAFHGRQHDCIRLGPVHGLREEYGMDMENFDKLQRGLKRYLKELEDLTRCTLFLNMNTLTAVGPSPRLGWVRGVLKICIKKKLSPLHVISAFICKYDQRIARVRDLDVSNVKNAGQSMSEHGLADVTLFFSEVKAKEMEGAFPMVESSLEKIGICCLLNLTNCTITISTTEATKEYPDAFEKARHLLELLTTNNVPPSLAIDLALNGKQHEFIKLGFQEGGLCSLFGIKEEQYHKRWRTLARSLKEIRDLMACRSTIYFTAVEGCTITCVCPSFERLRTFRKIVLSCIVEDLDPAYYIEKEANRELKKKIDRLLA